MEKTVFIGLTTRSLYDETHETRKYYDNESYFQFVKKSGGIPVLIGTVTKEEADALALLLDGLIITGGEDIDPAYYHKENTYSECTDKDIDESDVNLYHAFLTQNKPILGICRGFQVINVIEKGTLYQDLQKENSNTHEHNQKKLNPPLGIHDTAHECTFLEKTRLYEIFGKKHPVNTYHHQAIETLGEGLIASAYSDDGLIEAFEKENVIAVQWHPERLMHDEKHLKIGKLFIQDCLLAKKSR